MSDVKFACPSCGQRLRCDERHSGRRIRCPKCQHPTTIPAPSAQALDQRPPVQGEPGTIVAPCETLPPTSSGDSIGSAG